MKHFPLKDILACIDSNGIEIWDELDDDQKKEVNFWLLNRYTSSVVGTSKDNVALAVLKTNEFYNKNWNTIGIKHNRKLLWQLLCMSGLGEIQEHKWIGFKKKEGNNSKVEKFLKDLYPNMKEDEVELLARISTKTEIRELAKDLGYETKDIPI